MDFFHILHEVYMYKQEIVVIEIPGWKLKAELATNTIFEEGQVKNCPFWFKNSKK